MTIEEINEPISVILVLEPGKKVRPHRIKWRNRSYGVKTVHNTWREKVGNGYELHVALDTTAATNMQIAIDLSDLSCRLARISMEH